MAWYVFVLQGGLHVLFVQCLVCLSKTVCVCDWVLAEVCLKGGCMS